MRIDYCLPIIKPSQTEVLEAIRAYDGDYRYFEVWLDYVGDTDEAFVKQLIELLGERLIVLFRRQNLEAIQMDLDQRCKILELLNNTPALVDLDVMTQTEELNYIREHTLALNTIVSYHNYQQTPDTVQLTAILDTIKGYRPGIYKLATLCANRKDALRLLEQLLELKSQNRRVIVSGMGEFGMATRVFGALWGNEMTFAPVVPAEQSAPGQLTRSQLETIFKQLKG
jgi:3-dehydroquinate dehydratase-1